MLALYTATRSSFHVPVVSSFGTAASKSTKPIYHFIKPSAMLFQCYLTHSTQQVLNWQIFQFHLPLAYRSSRHLRKRACCGCGSRTSTVHESDSAEVEQRGGTTEATLSRKSFNYPLNVLSVNHTFRTIVRVERDWGLFDAIYCKESCGFITASTASDLDCDSCEMYC